MSTPKNAEQLHASSRGSTSAVSVIPTTIRLLFTGHSTALLASGPPSVPRSGVAPLRGHSVACMTPSPGSWEKPATQPRLLMLFPALLVPPSDSSPVTTYSVLPCRWSPCRGSASADVVTPMATTRMIASTPLRGAVPSPKVLTGRDPADRPCMVLRHTGVVGDKLVKSGQVESSST